MPKNTLSGQFKAGEIVWVLYRKSIYWPAKINNVYPREGKITYVFFPLEEKEQIFRTNDEKSIKAFVDYTLPQNTVNSDLIEAYELAKRYLAGDIVIKPSTPKILEIEPKLEPKKKSPKKYQIKQGEYKVKGQSFKAGDVLIVDTSLGMWPAFLSGIDSGKDIAKYILFPRNAQANKTIRQSSIDSIHIFPKDELETMINERGSEEEDLLSALKDVKQYLAELEAQPKSKTPKKPSTPIAKKTKSPKNTGQEDIYSFSKGLQRTFSSRRRTTVDLNESDYTIPTKKIKGHAKDLNDHGPPQEGTEYPESSSQANGNYTEKILTKVVSPINESKEKTDIADAVKAPTLFEVAISDQSRDYLEMIWNGFYPDPRINANHRAALYLDADFKLDFTNGNFITASDVDKLITEVSQWIIESPKMPKMSDFSRLQYIAKFAMPQLLIFAISKEQSCSLEEATQVFLARYSDSNETKSSVVDNTKLEGSMVRASPLANLALAAKMLDENSQD